MSASHENIVKTGQTSVRLVPEQPISDVRERMQQIVSLLGGEVVGRADDPYPDAIIRQGEFSVVLSPDPTYGYRHQDPRTALSVYAYGKRADLNFSIVPSVIDKLLNAIGFEDVKAGDPDFDAAYRINSSNPALVQSALTPQVIAKLRSLDVRVTFTDGGDDSLALLLRRDVKGVVHGERIEGISSSPKVLRLECSREVTTCAELVKLHDAILALATELKEQEAI